MCFDEEQEVEDLNEIVQTQTDSFPTGVSEHSYSTDAEMTAFLSGIDAAGSLDVWYGAPFVRDGKFVVRVQCGSWDDEEEDEE